MRCPALPPQSSDERWQGSGLFLPRHAEERGEADQLRARCLAPQFQPVADPIGPIGAALVAERRAVLGVEGALEQQQGRFPRDVQQGGC